MQASLLDQVDELFGPPFVCRPTNGYAPVCLGAHRVLVADVCRSDEVPARLQCAREQGENLRKDVTGEVEQRPPPEHAAEGGFSKVEVGGGGDTEATVWMKTARILDHAGREIHSGHIESAFSEVGSHRPRSAADVEDRPKLAHGFGEGVNRRLEPGWRRMSPTPVVTTMWA